MSKKEAAIECLEFNKGLNKVYVAQDETVFVSKNAAVNYSVKNNINPEKVEEFDRSVLQNTEDGDLNDESPTYQELKEQARALGFEGKGNPKTEDLIEFIESKKEA